MEDQNQSKSKMSSPTWQAGFPNSTYPSPAKAKVRFPSAYKIIAAGWSPQNWMRENVLSTSTTKPANVSSANPQRNSSSNGKTWRSDTTLFSWTSRTNSNKDVNDGSTEARDQKSATACSTMWHWRKRLVKWLKLKAYRIRTGIYSRKYSHWTSTSF